MDNRSDNAYTSDIKTTEREREMKEYQILKPMSVYIDRIENDKNLPITYSINIKTLSTPKQPLTCYITATPRKSNQLNYCKPSIGSDKLRKNQSRSSIHLPVTYSSSVNVPCHPPTITPNSPMILSSQSSHHHHYHHYHHHYYHHHHHRQPLPLSSQTSTTIKQKSLPRPASIASTRPATISTTTITSPDSSSPSTSKKPSKNILIPFSPKKRSSPPPLPSYSTLVWNWFHHTPSTKPSPHPKGSQSDYSETYRYRSPNKRSLLFKLLTSPMEKQSKSPRPCFSRKRLESSSSLPNKSSNPYKE